MDLQQNNWYYEFASPNNTNQVKGKFDVFFLDKTERLINYINP